jgi:hypothetical protein
MYRRAQHARVWNVLTIVALLLGATVLAAADLAITRHRREADLPASRPSWARQSQP